MWAMNLFCSFYLRLSAPKGEKVGGLPIIFSKGLHILSTSHGSLVFEIFYYEIHSLVKPEDSL